MSMIGTRVVRNEDPELLTTGGRFVDDVGPADALVATFVRSLTAHADITQVDVGQALEMPGVVAVFTAADLGLEPVAPGYPMLNQDMKRTYLAADRVRYVGDPIAVVVTRTREQGVDAAEMVVVDYEPRDPVLTPDQARTDATLLFPSAGTNTAFAIPAETDPDLFADCEVTVSLEFVNPRMNVAPIEPRAAVADWGTDSQGRPHLTQWSCTQFPHGTRDGLAAAMGVEADQVRVITPDVGGGFGGKGGRYPEDMVVAICARRLGRPVRWVETRSESMLSFAHGRGVNFVARLGGTRDGRISAYKLHVVQDCGAYPEIGALLPMFTKIMACGTYDIARVEVTTESVLTNTSPVGAFRGAGRPEATHAIERMVDLFAAEIEMDPYQVRRLNVLADSAFPHTTQTGAAMDTGAYTTALDTVAEAADYPGLRAEQRRRLETDDQPLLGLGWTSYVEITNPMGSPEFGSFEVRPDGSALALTGSSAHGQGHHTAFAQLASGVTGIPFDRIEVRHGDTAQVKRGGGTGGSRSLQVGGNAIVQAAESVVELAKELAAEMLEANPDDIVLDTATGAFSVAGTPAVSLDWSAIATRQAETASAPLAVETDFTPPGATFPFGAHLSVVEVDRETGRVRAVRHIACDDAGVIVNPLLVDGQVHGGIGSGIGLALMESFDYDDHANPMTANFMDYAIPSAAELPSFERLLLETPTDRNPIGAKGIGESGTIGATPAVQNAVVDALAHLGVRHVEMPTTAQRVWQAISQASTI